jgi:hypothetical protein
MAHRLTNPGTLRKIPSHRTDRNAPETSQEAQERMLDTGEEEKD